MARAVVAALAVLTACSGEPRARAPEVAAGQQAGQRAPMMGQMPMPPAGMRMRRTPRPAAESSGTATGSRCASISTRLLAQGRGVFLGLGNCYACHGRDARGTRVAPDLTDTTWLDIDGSYPAIAGLIRSGVPYPKRFPAPMPVLGGAPLDQEQVCAVAAYVYSTSHPAQ